MEFQITGHNIEVTPALRETVEKKLKKLEQLFDRINSIQVVLKVEKVQQIAEATLQLNGAELHASAEDDDMYAALDLLLDKLSRQLTKHKEKLRQH
ncbi:TPA: ribosome hibernation promoting factor [Providencia alcalifaciens]|uniref:Ribosome hibernation promoting factor n=4 Tax=Providencia TaxID=586 RepID=A0AAW9VCK0_9GAMM|nr:MULTISPECIES: ribosome hibernation promoting factor [Providencia]MTC75166.1 ribosome hibernation promoting factor [Providencia sp. wls1919]ATG16155.1 ribosome hibernation promoting factor [Providencia alcalifaciens]EEB45774.1 ribosomal subunit interface protein [Providencia alcalifaciens DSM 30120]EKT64092.1 sigma(54) modulation protein [Providencia alcalifaciens Dmel2]ETT04210.1 ribosomal subunit interface protein [Providencia alcalifaciens F90-2004]